MAGTIVICFTDIVESTEMLTRLGDDAFDDIRRRHFEALERQVEEHGGEVVKRLGDGLMTSFGSASDAVSAGVAMQRAVAAASRGPARDGVAVRVGISAGDATREDDDWYGAPVVEGARLCAAAAPGQILVSEVVRLLAGNRGGHEFRSVGALELKGLPEPVGAAEVAWTPAVATLAVPLPGPLAPDAGETLLPFSGRDEALDELRVEWKAAVAGERRVVMIAGEPGVGKTRLVAELARGVHADGALVLLGRTDEHVDAPYGPWREALRALVRSAPDEVLERHVAAHGGELARIVPELERRVDGLAAPIATDPETERLLLFEAVTGLVDASSAEAPVLLVLDDLHWADRSSLLLLLHLLKADAPAAVLVLATYRDTDVDRSHPLAGALADLRRQRGASRLALSGLDGEGIAALLVRAGGHDLDERGREFAATLWRETEGNPFFVGEVLRHLIETGGLVQEAGRWQAGATLDQTGLPEGVREVIGRRLAELPEATNTVLGVASVVGREFDVGLVAEVSGEPVGAILEALEPAEQARLIGESPGHPGRYSFAHALVRTVLVEELGTNRRVRLHRAAGVALEAQTNPPVGELAYHFGEAAVMGETDRAVRYAGEAAEQALGLSAPEDAVTFVRRALEAADLGDVTGPTRTALLVLLGRALGATGALDEARTVVADAFDRAVGAGDVDTACEAAIEYGGVQGVWEAYGTERGPVQLRTVLELLESGDSERRGVVLARLGEWLVSAPGDEGAQVAREAYDMSVRVDAPGARRFAASVVALTVRNLDPRAQLAFNEEALALTGGVVTGDSLAAYGGAADARLALGDLNGVDTAIDQQHAAAEACGLRSQDFWRETWLMTRALIEGRFAAARALADALDARPHDQVVPRLFAAIGRTDADYLQGDWAGAVAGWAECRRVEPTMMAPYVGYEGATSDLVLVRREWDRWRTEVEPMLPAWSRPPSVAMLSENLRLLDEREASAAFAAEFAGHSGQFFTNGVCWFHGPFDTALGVLSVTGGELDGAVAYLTRAVGQCDAIASPSWAMIARLELATALRVRSATGDEELAAAAVSAARRVGEELGMSGWLERLDRLDAGDREPWRPAPG